MFSYSKKIYTYVNFKNQKCWIPLFSELRWIEGKRSNVRLYCFLSIVKCINPSISFTIPGYNSRNRTIYLQHLERKYGQNFAVSPSGQISLQL